MPKKITNELVNFYETTEVKKLMKKHDNPNFDLHNIKLPFRMAVVSQSGGGKTNFVMNLINLFSKGKGTFWHIYIYHKIEEPLYDYLKEKCKDKITFYKKSSEVPECRTLKPVDETDDSPALFIFDDCINDKNQDKINDYFTYGRKALNNTGISCIYIAQKYFKINTTIRGQLNYIILLKIRGSKDLNLILRDNDIGIDIEDFKDIYKDATTDDLNFLKIDCSTRDDNKVLSKNFTDYYDIAELIE